MKKSILLSCIILFVFAFQACKEKEDDPKTDNTPNSSTKSFSAKVDSKLFENNASYSYGTNPHNNYSVLINTSNNDIFTNWAVSFYGDTVGTYSFMTGFPVDGAASATYSYGPFTDIVTYDAIDGKIVVTEIDAANSTITATFSFTAEDADGNQVVITEGKMTKLPKF